MTVIEYNGYRIDVRPLGKGWRASIYSPGELRALNDSPSDLEKSAKETIIAEAKKIVDAHRGAR